MGYDDTKCMKVQQTGPLPQVGASADAGHAMANAAATSGVMLGLGYLQR
ncbi:hypothetical protein AB0L50_17600 [Streptomyces flaveolus]